MEENKDEKAVQEVQQEPEITQKPETLLPKTKNSKKLWLVVSVIVVLVAGVVFTWWIMNKDSSTNSSPETDLQGTEEASTVAPVEEQQNNESTPKLTTYTAEVGKFTLTLPSEYVIIRGIDGVSDGGPITYLTIGKKADATGSLVDSHRGQEVTIRALDSALSNSFDEFVSSSLSSLGTTNQETKDQISVDGISAKVYSVSGLRNELHLFWMSDDSFIHLSGPSADSSLTNDLKNVVNGLNHN